MSDESALDNLNKKEVDSKPISVEAKIEKESDVSDIDLPDMPMPEEQDDSKEVTKDTFDSAFKFCFVGAGQAGGRMAEAFWKLGYRRVCAINTTEQDLVNIEIPAANKLVMNVGEGGAGKQPENGLKAIGQYHEDVYDLMKRSFGKEFDRIMVCAGAGGGTGSGVCDSLIKISQDIASSFNKNAGNDSAVGVLVSLPMATEGKKVNANALIVLNSLFKQVDAKTISPLVIVDNDRISKLYPNLPVSKFWGVANRSIANLFNTFNKVAAENSQFTTFDKADFKDIITSGILSFGVCLLDKWQNSTDISYAIRENLKKNILVSNFDMRSAKVAGCIFIGHPDVLNQMPQENLEHGFDMLTRIMQEKSTVHRGIYQSKNIVDRDKKPSLIVYTILGNLSIPKERIDEIAKISKS